MKLLTLSLVWTGSKVMYEIRNRDILKRNALYREAKPLEAILHSDLFEVEAVYNAKEGDYHIRCIYSNQRGRKGLRIVAMAKWLELVESP